MTTRHFTIGFMLFALTFGCGSVDSFIDSGDYDKAISKAENKLQGKKKKREKYVKSLEEAFAKATRKDMKRIEVLRARGSASDWEEIIRIGHQIDRRQAMVEPYLPLVDKGGYEASFQFVRVERILEDARYNLSNELYAEGTRLLQRGREGDKLAARKAYDAFSKLMDHTDQFPDDFSLRNEAKDLGISRVVIIQENKANAWVPDYVAERITSDFPVSDNFWTKFYFPEDSVAADLEAYLILTGVDVGPEVQRKENIERSRRIEDGWDYALDANGNVAKDTLGNDIRNIRYRNVQATIVRTNQEKVSTVNAYFEVRDAATGKLIRSTPINGEARFYHRAQWYYGDSRALRNRESKYIDLLPFPSDERLIIQAAESIKPLFVDELKSNFYVSS